MLSRLGGVAVGLLGSVVYAVLVGVIVYHGLIGDLSHTRGKRIGNPHPETDDHLSVGRQDNVCNPDHRILTDDDRITSGHTETARNIDCVRGNGIHKF